MLNCWIFDGELIDNSLEFFIACDESSKLEKLWKSKYSIRNSMLPSFISKELAQKVGLFVSIVTILIYLPQLKTPFSLAGTLGNIYRNQYM